MDHHETLEPVDPFLDWADQALRAMVEFHGLSWPEHAAEWINKEQEVYPTFDQLHQVCVPYFLEPLERDGH